MLDVELIRSDPEFVRAPLLKRVNDVDLAPILEADALRRKLATEVDGIRQVDTIRCRPTGDHMIGQPPATLRSEIAECPPKPNMRIYFTIGGRAA